MITGQDFFLVKGWSIEGCATKVAEWDYYGFLVT